MEQQKEQNAVCLRLDPTFKAAWIGALRTGDYKQGTGMLYNAEAGSFCCLGIAAIVEGLTPSNIQNKGYPSDMSTAHMTDNLTSLEWIEKEIGVMNDEDKMTFSQIADHIEQNY